MRPRIVVSRCLGFDACRWNGTIISAPFVASLKEHVDFLTPCPEADIGLGIPRNPIRIVKADDDSLRLLQPGDGRDITELMQSHADSTVDELSDIDGFILKSRSPSCGIKDVKIYASPDESNVLGKGDGFFGAAVKAAFADVAIEDEGRLRNLGLREHFLTRVFLHARLRVLLSSPTMAGLVGFHSACKYLLMEYGPAKLSKLGRIVANHEKRPIERVLDEYQHALSDALAAPPRIPTVVNALTHMYGYFSKRLKSAEKRLFERSLEDYRARRVGVIAVLQLLRSWVARFGEPYLEGQIALEPFPSDLLSSDDSGRGREPRSA